jgi:hypothetical protein
MGKTQWGKSRICTVVGVKRTNNQQIEFGIPLSISSKGLEDILRIVEVEKMTLPSGNQTSVEAVRAFIERTEQGPEHMRRPSFSYPPLSSRKASSAPGRPNLGYKWRGEDSLPLAPASPPLLFDPKPRSDDAVLEVPAPSKHTPSSPPPAK